MTATPPDAKERLKIVRDLDRTMLVEASAGTGKTTMLIERMLALLANGKCDIDQLAAVTFTRKAAAEIRARFQVRLEREFHSSQGDVRERLRLALDHVDRCFIGTIHSFCARLLRERPIEACVDLGFAEIDEDEDLRLREQAWREYTESLFANDDRILDELEEVGLQLARSTRRYDPLLANLEELGLEVLQLGPTFFRLADFPDIDQWPAPTVTLPDMEPLLRELRKYLEHAEQFVETLPENPGNDHVMPLVRQVVRMAGIVNLERRAELMEVLERFRILKRSGDLVQRNWPLGPKQALAELDRWNQFAEQCALPAVTLWREHRYEVVMRAIQPAIQVYDRLRRERNALNFQDLLLKAAALLRDKPQVREYFRSRFRYLLVDEFQDTDPIQAEVMFLLASDDPRETDWRKCRPVAGSLMVVGDPKQSIYRFRRADIVTYRQVKDLIQQSGGEIVSLSANFRSTASHIDWVNHVFSRSFDEYATDQMPAKCDLQVGRSGIADATMVGVQRIVIPPGMRKNADIVGYEAAIIANTIRRALDEGWTVPRSEPDDDPRVRPNDFLIITWNTRSLSVYGEHLQQLGIPHQVTGGSSVNRIAELQWLYVCLRAVTRPDDPVALLAVLRSELFGISDQALFAYRKAGGTFSFHAPLPELFSSPELPAMQDAFERLRRYSTWLRQLPSLSAVEKILCDLGLVVRACTARDGSTKAGGLLKTLELIRAGQRDAWSSSELVDYLEQLVQKGENHDALPLKPDSIAPVRIMNLHKAKGLEAPIVFLADATGKFDHPVEMHIDRTGLNSTGYLAVYGQKRGRSDAPLLSHPRGWHERAEYEEAFLKAEKVRLMYVAATRAGSQLVIVDRRTEQNPWRYFEPYLDDCPELLQQPLAEQPLAEFQVTLSDAQQVQEASRQHWQIACDFTYEVFSAKMYATTTEAKEHGSGEDAAQFGTVIHALLEAAIARPRANLERLAVSLLQKEGLESARAPEALEIVRSVSDSPMWKRAQSSQKCLVEIPFSTLLDDPARAKSVPGVLRGVIDLAFLENDQWVIVDYKTEQISPNQVKPLAYYYRNQVALYAAQWEKLTGTRVSETGLFFTHLRHYERLTGS